MLILGGGVTLLTYDGSGGGFTESEVIPSSSVSEGLTISPFNHKDRAMLLCSSNSGIEIYDVTDGCKLIAKNPELSERLIGGVLSIAEYRDNILVGLGGMFLNNCSILEINPVTCEVVDSCDLGSEADVTVVDGTIYVPLVQDGNAVLVTMDKLGNITGSIELPYFHHSTVSQGVMYVGIDREIASDLYPTGLYRLNGLNIETVIPDLDVVSIKPDGKGGLYCVVGYSDSDKSYNRYIYHWDGTDIKLIYDTDSFSLGLNYRLSNIYYDVNNSILYTHFFGVHNNGDYNDVCYALNPDGSGFMATISFITNIGCFEIIGNPSEATSTNKSSNMASAAYVSSSGAVNLITYNGFDAFTESEVIQSKSDACIVSFNYKDEARLLHSSSSGVAIYDVTDGCKLISSNSSLSLSLDTVAEYGNNILLAGYGRGGFIIELNPETCEIVNEYNYVASSDSNYDLYRSRVTVAKGIIYAFFSPNEDYLGVLVTMDRLGNITGTLEKWNNLRGNITVSKNVAYVSIREPYTTESKEAGIYRLNGPSFEEVINGINAGGNIKPDGNGGLYYCVRDSSPSRSYNRYIYHWDGTNSKLIYDTDSLGLTYTLGGVAYDVNNSILYTRFFDSFETSEPYHDIWYALKPDGSGFITTTSYKIDEGGSFVIIGNPSESTSSTSTESTTTNGYSNLPTALIEPVTLTDDVIAKLAALVSIDKSQLKFITAANISAPQEPTQKMIDYMKNDGYEPAYKLNVLTVDEDGYYVYLVNIPEEFVGKSVNDIKIYALGQKDFSASSIKESFWSLINGLLNYGELTNLTGEKISSFPAKVLAIGMLQAGQPFSVFLAKLLFSLTGASVGCVTGIGLLASMSAIAIFIRLRRK